MRGVPHHLYRQFQYWHGVIDKEGRDMLKLVSSTNAAILDLDYQIDLREAKEKIGRRNCIRGNTNTQVLGSQTYSIRDVSKEIEKTIEIGKSGGMYQYAAGCEWPWEPLSMASRNLGIARTLVDKLGRYE